MADHPEVLASSHRVMNQAYQHFRDTREMLRAQAKRPLIPVSDNPDEPFAEKPQPRRERIMEYGMHRVNPEGYVGPAIDQAMDELKIPPGHLPRAVVMAYVDAEKDFQKEMKQRGIT